MDSLKKQIELLIDEGKKFTFSNFSNRRDPRYGGSDTPEWLSWKTRIENILSKNFSPNSAPIALMRKGLAQRTQGNGPDKFKTAKDHLLAALKQSMAILEDDIFNEIQDKKSVSKKAAYSNKVFIVHGHDHMLKVELENFLKEIGLEPIVLHRQADQGKTIIEKFEHYSDVGYAFILLTPDEISYLASEEEKEDSARMKEKRARPNVIFEFGFFVAKLGRKRVCCLHKGDVSLPSDLGGLVYKKVDDDIEGIAFSIIKELKAAGYEINI